MKWADVVAIGPGIGTDTVAREMVKTVLEVAAVPIVMDADALNILSEDINVLLRPHTELIVTPHPGEMARLACASVSYVKDNLIAQAEEFARAYNVICVLKDARTVCAIPYGKTYLNLTGNHGMATAGSGDVLCGLIAGLLGSGARPWGTGDTAGIGGTAWCLYPRACRGYHGKKDRVSRPDGG
ncbi:yjeF-like protein/carbohydrate kinase [Roseburia sp. CAG:182]|nr:yjeF-like protein/carbohydrate kinase [Roseburia sp. CAG:182]